VLQSRVLVIDSATLPPEARLAVAEVSQTASGLRVKMHDKHAALVSLGRHLGLFRDHVKVAAVYGISAEPMSAEEWKRQYVKPG
jgi:phage terminase small subunit